MAQTKVAANFVNATGTPSATTFLRGDGSWATPGIAWQSVQTTGFTAVAGRAYPCNTTSAAFTVTLPASPSAGDQIIIVDYARKFATNNLTVDPNGNKIQSLAANALFATNGTAVSLVYVDSTQGWLTYALTTATISQPYSVDWLLAAGGGAGGSTAGSNEGSGGGGAGGLGIASAVSISPGTVLTITVGGGGSPASNTIGGTGSNSVISFGSITETAYGGGGGGGNGSNGGAAGGSSGGVRNGACVAADGTAFDACGVACDACDGIDDDGTDDDGPCADDGTADGEDRKSVV